MGDHLLGSYLRSFLAILLAQFSAKGFPGGMDGVVRLADKSPPIQVSYCWIVLLGDGTCACYRLGLHRSMSHAFLPSDILTKLPASMERPTARRMHGMLQES